MFLFTRARHSAGRVIVAQGPHMGDSIMCLPIAGILKEYWPHAQVFFVGPSKLRPVIEASAHVDGFLNVEDALADPGQLAALKADIFLNPFPHMELAAAAARARIPQRVGNLRRTRLLRYCNQFVYYGRRKSGLHEAVLHLKDLGALGIPCTYTPQELKRHVALTRIKALPANLIHLIDPQRFNLILHPRSSGNGREWPPQHYAALAAALPAERFKIFLTGIAEDRETLRRECPRLLDHPGIVDLIGMLSVEQLVSFVAAADGLVASSTGPLHLAAALGKHALGLYPPRKPLDIQRWGPIGELAESLSRPGECVRDHGGCPAHNGGRACRCMHEIAPQQVCERISRWPQAHNAPEIRLTGD